MNSPATIHVGGLQLIYVGQELRRDPGDGNVVDVDVLLADQIEQKVERAVVDLRNHHREGRKIGLVVAGFELDEGLLRSCRRRLLRRNGDIFNGWLSRRFCGRRFGCNRYRG